MRTVRSLSFGVTASARPYGELQQHEEQAATDTVVLAGAASPVNRAAKSRLLK